MSQFGGLMRGAAGASRRLIRAMRALSGGDLSRRRRGWWSIIGLLPVAGPVAVVAMGLNLLIGVLPLGFVIGTSVAVERVAGDGRGAWGAVLVAVGLAVASLLLQAVLAPFQ